VVVVVVVVVMVVVVVVVVVGVVVVGVVMMERCLPADRHLSTTRKPEYN
jgi:hypothetical protein